MSNLSIRSSDNLSIESDNESSIPGDDLPEDILEAAEIAGNDDDVPCSPPPPYDYVLEEKCSDYNCLEEEDNTASTPTNGPVIVHTSSKEFYKAVAKQFGLTCKMSDDCRCYECQSHYFDCSDYFERKEQEKSDGGLSAGTPMFINEAMQGSVCNIL
ncbi:uncharacterized protein LOC123307527 [Coccinella septempunctata]|uniref:uncharacterized protein LOC123307527 n=1 Tax=Coccinella septempunctata TaxID=41139 RepID=UPI001D06EDD1|nr:uncharacterized protein LOC123307527 [Coccinella septempunctata]XP_044745808.1 uncharacterized protein LOC123307527 [Coccinella septempunctata]XP_044745809.1 uncharacterized protein LOC123307527 [Coccinella septempunctata]